MNCTPETTSRASKYTCEQLGVCQCATPCLPDTSTLLIIQEGLRHVPPEAGSACDEVPAPTRLTEQQDQPISVWDGIWFYGTVLITSAASVAVTVGLCSYVWHRWVI